MRSKMWSLFFLIVTGRALENDDLAAAEYEDVFAFMYGLSKTAPLASTQPRPCTTAVI